MLGHVLPLLGSRILFHNQSTRVRSVIGRVLFPSSGSFQDLSLRRAGPYGTLDNLGMGLLVWPGHVLDFPV